MLAKSSDSKETDLWKCKDLCLVDLGCHEPPHYALASRLAVQRIEIFPQIHSSRFLPVNTIHKLGTFSNPRSGYITECLDEYEAIFKTNGLETALYLIPHQLELSP